MSKKKNALTRFNFFLLGGGGGVGAGRILPRSQGFPLKVGGAGKVYITDSQSDQLPDGLIAQSVEHCSGIAAVIFQALISQLLKL